MAKSKSDIANMAIRILLQKVGEYYDLLRGYAHFVPTEKQKEEVLNYFIGQCVFCGKKLSKESTDWDHLIPINKTALGLHAWGNVVPSCKPCHIKKHKHDWKAFAATAELKSRLISFQLKYNYKPTLALEMVAQTLYEDVGAVAMTLIELRYKQAQELLKTLQPDGNS